MEWLQDAFKLDLTLVSRLGGHSQPRTHRGHDAKFPGMAITYALMEALEDIADEEPERIRIIKKSRVTKLLKEGSKVTGVEYEFDGKKFTDTGPVILATGGYAADFGEDSFLKKYKPETFGLSTTNGAHATGDGQKMIMAIGGNGIDLEKVQVHPTGLVDPKDPKSKWKFLAAEALRGEGGLLLNAEGDRFCDELGHRDYVTGEMWKNKFPIRLVLNSKASNVLDFHTRHYSGRGLMKKMSGDELAKEIGCGREKLDKTFKTYNDIAAGEKKDPYGKKFFHNLPLDVNDTFHVALMEPVLHFTMGGIEINDQSQVIEKSTMKPFEALFACGEVAGGVHGANRLGGSSLLGCVVYGRVAGDSAAKYMFEDLITGGGASSAAERLGQISLHIDPGNPGRFTVDWSGSGAGGVKGAASSANQPEGQVATAAVTNDRDPPTSSSSSAKTDPGAVKKPNKGLHIPDKEFTLEEVAEHNTKENVWVVVKGLVMDCTEFLPDHPGGAMAIVNYAGKDASEEFAMLHEDRVIPKYAPSAVIGKLKGVTPHGEW